MSSALPPRTRSAAAEGLTQAAQAGHFALQVCTDCHSVQYPPRDVCGQCLHDELQWQVVDNRGLVVASTTLHHSNEAYFQDHLPWRIGTVQLACGPVVIAHLKDNLQTGDPTELRLELDAANVGVLVAHAPTIQQG
ncbi:Zn-ribbon domain-containing OB-fold protein [Paenalcaligenes hominis]|uniref:Zn-ribbon domain-containing OB-fold protein n=1 Tax=Paenalcaligenes hominis TaxID=643674 RepID=UPI0035232695